MGVSKNGWFIIETHIKWMMTAGTPFSGNHRSWEYNHDGIFMEYQWEDKMIGITTGILPFFVFEHGWDIQSC